MKKVPSDAADDAPARRLVTTPAFWCALVGVASLVMGAWVMARWAAAGVHSPDNAGGSISPVRTAITWAVQAATVTIAIICAVYVVRDCRSRGHFTLNAGMFLGFILASWQSPLFNYREITFVVNRYVLRVNSWGPYIPGWDPPHRELLFEAPVAITGVGFGILILWVWAQCWMALKIADRFPRWSWIRLVTAIFLAGMIADAVFEFAWISTGIYSHAHAWRPAALFAGHWYNLPLSKVFSASVFTTPFALMWYLERTRGTTPWIYRGAELASTPTTANLTRALSAIGVANIATLVYLGWFIAAGTVGGPMPADTPSYMWPPNAR
ncbi:hypothetical protein BTM25_44720 [Actinomadura rubteroloni]|uniref:Spirocyclase, AveC family n=1 Tax=Actinomadura rubteroloni TaxID=1926885 RepID=A0A2P4UE40_9ACTN|nr:spirocyclase AveC family protein [Actinomadura rubteroloni]POM23319.1 hypothetical protein BTM25_44720 [Actinomadura rubteroloni]